MLHQIEKNKIVQIICIIFFFCRRLCEVEKQAIADHMNRLLDCQLSHVYPEGIDHRYMRHNERTKPMMECARNHLNKQCSAMGRIINVCESPSINKRFENGCYNAVVETRKVGIKKQATLICQSQGLLPLITRQ